MYLRKSNALHARDDQLSGGNGAFFEAMLVRVAKQDVRLGMYVHAIEGSWMDHPFWRSRFLLSEQSQLERVFASKVEYLVIDAARGLDPSQLAPVLDERTAKSERQPLSARERITELRRAASTIKRSKVAVMGLFEDARLGKAVQTASMGPIVEEISQSVSRDPSIILNIAKLKTKDEYTYLHSVAVCALMINLGRSMGLDEGLTQEIGMAGLLHDVGKMAIPETILKKPARLDELEMETVRNHPQRGYEILSASAGVNETALDVCLHHHEKLDGTGYPDGLKDGETVGGGEMKEASLDHLVTLMTGREVKDLYPRTPRAPGRVLLEAKAAMREENTVLTRRVKNAPLEWPKA